MAEDKAENPEDETSAEPTGSESAAEETPVEDTEQEPVAEQAAASDTADETEAPVVEAETEAPAAEAEVEAPVVEAETEAPAAEAEVEAPAAEAETEAPAAEAEIEAAETAEPEQAEAVSAATEDASSDDTASDDTAEPETAGDSVTEITVGGDAPSEDEEDVEKPRVPQLIRGKIDKLGVAMGTGRRKTSVARVRIKDGDGQLVINGRPLDQYFQTERDRLAVQAPLQATDTHGTIDVWVRVKGGGTTGQAGAIVLGIARALQARNPELHERLAGGGYLTRDGRMVERKKFGYKKARKSFQFSKR